MSQENAQQGPFSRKILLSLAVIGAAASIAGLGTYATFTDSATATQAVSSGTVDINLDATGITNTFSVAATNIAAGDTIQRAVKLSNAGSLGLSTIKLTTAATTSSLLNTDTTNGLQLLVESCSVAYVEVVLSKTFTCAGTTQVVLASTPIIVTDATLANLASITTAGSDNLRVTLTLPTSADNTFQGLSSTVTLTFTGTQRAATNA